MTSLSLCRLMPFEAVKAPKKKKGDVSVHSNSTQTHLLYYIYVYTIYIQMQHSYLTTSFLPLTI